MTSAADLELESRFGDTADVVLDSLIAYGEQLDGGCRVAHAGARLTVRVDDIFDEAHRNTAAGVRFSDDATLVEGAGNRAAPETSDPWRTCFERDADRVRYSPAFRRLAHKCQVFIAPTDDHLRTRLTHALEVTQVAVAATKALGLNHHLAEAIALGHDCGHGPAGHASEEAFAQHLDGGYDHAPWGADVVLAGLNLCNETLDGIRSHSWRLDAPSTPEAEIVAWADRIAYVCHDFDDAQRAGIVTTRDLPDAVTDTVGGTQSQQVRGFIEALVTSTAHNGYVSMDAEHAAALDEFRRTNYSLIYLRDEAREQATKVIDLLGALVEYHTEHAADIPDVAERLVGRWDITELGEHDAAARFAAVHYVSSMTDRYALTQGLELLGIPEPKLPAGAD